MRDVIQQASESPKVAVATVTASVATGVGSQLELVSGVLGIIATTVAILLTCILIVTHLRKSRLETKRTLLEIEKLERKP